MAVTETLRALGSWGLTFKRGMPDELWKAIDYFGHIAIVPGRKPAPLDDSLLRTARYVGPVTKISDNTAERRSIGGAGMALWLGDAEGKGDVFLDAITVNGDFDDVIRALLPASGAITEGILHVTGETFGPSTFQYQTPREVIDYVCQTLGDHAWRVNGDGTLDAGLESDLFIVSPKCVVVAKDINVDDLFLRGLAGMAETDRDVEDYTTGVALLGQGINGQFVTAETELTPGEIPFVDIHGNKVRRVRIIQESDTDSTNAPARALLQLNRFKGTRDALTLSTTDYDIKGKAAVGDYIWVYDPGMDLLDINNEVIFRGMRINPFKLRLTETSWPITNRMSVLYRTGVGEWLDLSSYFVPEQGVTNLVVGGYNRSLSEGGVGTFPISRPPDTSVPDQVEWNEPFLVSVYQSPTTGQARGEVILSWDQPMNTDATTIVDGSHYEIRYRRATVPHYPVTIAMVEAMGLTNAQLAASGATWGTPIVFPETDWQNTVAPFDTTSFRLQELVPAMPYEVQIRAVDSANPANRGAWSDLALFQTTNDDIAPSTPAPPFIASNPLYVQMTHELGVSTGGTFNLERDIHHLELHGGTEPLFIPSADTLLGKALANYGMIVGEIPVVQTFSISTLSPVYYKVIAVDEAGNKSSPSTAVVSSVGLIDSQYISSLIASKITSGTISASVIVGGRIATMPEASFPGVELNSNGLNGWTTGGFRTLHWDSATGKLHVDGTGGIEIQDGALVVKNAAGQVIVEVGECADGRHGVQVYKDDGSRVARIGELESSTDEGIEFRSDGGSLVRANTLAFGIQSASLSGAVSTTLTSYNGNTPSVSVDIGNSGNALVHIACWIIAAGITGGSVSFFGTGPSGASLAASDLRALSIGNTNMGGGRVFHVTGLTAGTWSFFMTYKTTTAGQSCQFIERHIAVQPF